MSKNSGGLKPHLNIFVDVNQLCMPESTKKFEKMETDNSSHHGFQKCAKERGAPTVNLALIGLSQCGKTTLLNRLSGNFGDRSAFGLDFENVWVTILEHNVTVKVKIWDTKGQK